MAGRTLSFRKSALVLLIGLAGFGHLYALDLNLANEAELDSLRGIGPATTAQIMAARQHHVFVSWSDFMTRVRGIGPATAQSLSDQGATIGNDPYIAKDRPKPPPPGV